MAECREEPDSKGAAIPADDGPLGDRLCLSGRWSKRHYPTSNHAPILLITSPILCARPRPGREARRAVGKDSSSSEDSTAVAR